MKNNVLKLFPMEEKELKELLMKAKKKALQTLNSTTIINAPPEKLTDLRDSFEDKFE